MGKLVSDEMTFAERVKIHRVWEDTGPALQIAADEAVRGCKDDVAVQAVALCRALRCGEDDPLPGVFEVAWLRAKLEATTRLAEERGRKIVAYFFTPIWTTGVGVHIATYSDDFVLTEHLDDARVVVASSLCDDFDFAKACKAKPQP